MSRTEDDDFEVEVDESQEDEVHIEYDIATYPSDFTLAGIVEMWHAGDITIPDFQREYVWSIRQASLLIESFLLGLPVPPVFFYIDDENKNLVIDGQQRILSTAFYFDGFFGTENIQGRRQVFRLQGLDAENPFSKRTFEELPSAAQRKLRNTVLRAINIRQLSPTDENTSIFHIFERLNTGGTPLKAQEIRNVVFRGNIVSILRELNRDPFWRALLGRQTLSKHQEDVELVLRILALRKGADSYEKPMKEYLNQAMRKNQKGNTLAVRTFQGRFSVVARFLVDSLGSRPFHLRGRLNTSALDSVFCTVLENFGMISPERLADGYQRLKEDPQFATLTTIGTTDTGSVRERFRLVRSYLID
jgi:hypothetical protein